MVCQCVIYPYVVFKLLALKYLVEMSKSVNFQLLKARPARFLEMLGSISQRLTPVPGVHSLGYTSAEILKLVWRVFIKSRCKCLTF